jgi:RNA polymerase sigma-70 factor, ECF subfamily
MSDYPVTDPELIAAIADRGQQDAWYEFERIYAPALLVTLIKRGLTRTDAEECCQRIFAKLILAVDRYEHDGRPASFRRWLYRVARNETTSFLRQQAHHPNTLSPSGLLQREIDDSGRPIVSKPTTTGSASFEAEIEMEYCKNVFLEASTVVQAEVSSKQWQAFWRTMVEAEPTHQVAKNLNMSVGAVYVAKGRILKKLQSIVKRWEDNR